MSDSAADSTPVKMTVKALVMDPVSNMPVVILEQAESNAFLPIWIGVCEANSIALELEGVTTPRPMTHDLIASVIDELGYQVKHIYIHSLDESVFLASIFLSDPYATPRKRPDARLWTLNTCVGTILNLRPKNDLIS